jgi:Kef-type K+ transport system membrane component KefB
VVKPDESAVLKPCCVFLMFLSGLEMDPREIRKAAYLPGILSIIAFLPTADKWLGVVSSG